VVLTSKCHKSQTRFPCDLLQLGAQSSAYHSNRRVGQDWGVSSENEIGRNTLWQQIAKVIDTKSKLRDALYDNGDLLKRLLQEDGNLLDKEQRHCLAALLPLCTVYIYCAPCACLIHTALRVGGRIGSRLVEIVVRPDDRLISSCCTSSGRTIGLRSVLDHVRQWEAHWAGESEIAGFLDPDLGGATSRSFRVRRTVHIPRAQSRCYHTWGSGLSRTSSPEGTRTDTQGVTNPV
jgi:hypothetical protein